MKKIIFAASLLLSSASFAAIDTYQFNSVGQEQQFRELTLELRCPKCQNNSIGDSNSMIASDMRAKVYELMMAGQSKQDVIDYMVARYGNFVTYKPPVTFATLILWLGPLMVLIIGAVLIFSRSRRRLPERVDVSELSQAEQQRLAELLKEQEHKL